MEQKRRLAAILNADVAGYTRLMAEDEAATVASLEACREIFDRRISSGGGRVVDMAGDSVLAIFDSAVEAARAALDIQGHIASRNRELGDRSPMRFRIGLNLGDVLVKADGHVYGDGVNVAARLQALAEPGGVCLSGNLRDLAAAALDVDFEDLGEQTVKNVAQPIRAWRVAGVESGAGMARARPPRSPRPSIAVLPFENVGGDREQEYLADGIAEDIITELSRVRAVLVIARNSSFAFKRSADPVGAVAEQLGARFVVHGSVRRSGQRARITAQLIDAENGNQLWSERYDRELDDMFAIQDEIAKQILTVVPTRIEAAELSRSRAKPTANLAAYDYLLRAKYHHHKGTAEDNRSGLEMVEHALELDPEFAQAYAWKACLIAQALLRGYADSAWAVSSIVDNLDAALRLDDEDFETHRVLSGVHLIQRNYDRAIFHAARAQDLNPNDPRVMSQYGETLTALGRAEDAIVILESALQVDPWHPDRRLGYLGIAQFVARRYHDAIASLRQISDLKPEHHVYLAACHAQAGMPSEAARHAQEVRRLLPGFNFREYLYQIPYRDDGDREHHREALIRAGLADGD